MQRFTKKKSCFGCVFYIHSLTHLFVIKNWEKKKKKTSSMKLPKHRHTHTHLYKTCTNSKFLKKKKSKQKKWNKIRSPLN